MKQKIYEVKTVEEWEENGVPCRVMKHPMGHYMGYVKVDAPDDLPMEYGYPDVEAPGGITYGPDEDGWIGFDTAHAFDVNVDENGERFGRGPNLEPLGDNPRVWNPESVREATAELARRV